MRFWRRKPSEQSPDVVESTAPEGGDVEPVLEPTEEERAEVHEQTERAVERTRRGFFSRLGGLFERPDFDDALWDELEEILIGSDAGLGTATVILDAVRGRVKADGDCQSAVPVATSTAFTPVFPTA